MMFRPYQKTDKQQIIDIFLSNCPKYFKFSDQTDLEDFLDHYADSNYLVILKDQKVIGCGGHYTKPNMHGIAWVMFERNALGYKNLKSISTTFYNEIEKRIKTEGLFYDININTTQLMAPFFESFGFTTYQVIKNGFGGNLDEYKMIKKLTYD